MPNEVAEMSDDALVDEVSRRIRECLDRAEADRRRAGIAGS